MLLDEAVATYDCSMHEEVVAGDHVIVLLALHQVGAGAASTRWCSTAPASRLHRDDLDPARLDGRINGKDVDAA